MIVDQPQAPTAPAPLRAGKPVKRPGLTGRLVRWGLGLLVVSTVATVYFVPSLNSLVMNEYHKVAGSKHEDAAPSSKTEEPPSSAPFDGSLSITKTQMATLGLTIAPVMAQTEPLRLAVSGRTAYDPNTLSRVRPKFKSLIDKVYVEFGQTVKAGDPLVDVFSADLAEAKGLYETKLAQWTHDHAELTRSAELLKTKAVSEKEYLSVFNDEQKSGTEAKIAKDKLMVLGLSVSEIEAVPKEDGTRKAKMTLRAQASGVVISKDVVQGNIYDDNDTLLTIAPLDHFWVYGYVYPSDASRIALGQTWVIDCQFAGQKHRKTIEAVTSEIDKETKTLVIRTQIENQDGKIKADMLVGGYIEIPPPTGIPRTVVPRLAMVTEDGGDYVFVAKPGNGDEVTFERRIVRVVHESSDGVILAQRGTGDQGISPGEQVAARGSLLLMQMYDDQSATQPAH